MPGRAEGQGEAGVDERCGRELQVLKGGLCEAQAGSHVGGDVGACGEQLSGLGVTVYGEYGETVSQEFDGVAAFAAAEVDGERGFGRCGMGTASGKLAERCCQRFAWAFAGDGLEIARPVTMLCVDVGGFEHSSE